MPGLLPEGDVTFDTGFAPELLEIGIETVFGRLWSRPGLSRRDRSLVTLGILIALRADGELDRSRSDTSRAPGRNRRARTVGRTTAARQELISPPRSGPALQNLSNTYSGNSIPQ